MENYPIKKVFQREQDKGKETTKNGCTIVRAFSMAGSDGSELDIFGKLHEKGYEELYYDAPYHWGMINVSEKKIFTYTEGDTALIECGNKEKLLTEAEGHINFIKKNYGKSAHIMTGEWPEVKKKIEAVK